MKLLDMETDFKQGEDIGVRMTDSGNELREGYEELVGRKSLSYCLHDLCT